MAYLKDFYPLDIDDSCLEYVISELKYDDNDIFIVGCGETSPYTTTLSLVLFKMAKCRKCAVMKALQN